MRHALLLILLITVAPIASAQVPDPDELVTTACATIAGIDRDLRDTVPLCPQEEPAGPADPKQEEHEHGAPGGAHQPAEAAQDLGRQAAETVEESAADPERAPERIVAFLATVRQYVEDLLGLRASLIDLDIQIRDAVGEAAREGAREAAAAAGVMAERTHSLGAKVTDRAGAAWEMLARWVAPDPTGHISAPLGRTDERATDLPLGLANRLTDPIMTAPAGTR